MRIPSLVAIVLVLIACTPPESSTAQAPQAAPQTDEEKTLYVLGVALGRNIQPFALTANEVELVAQGLRDSVLGNDLKAPIDVYGPRLQALAEQRSTAAANAEKEASAAWVAEQAGQPGAQRSASGVVFIPIREGTGANPTAASTVRVHYHGTLRDGSVFDSSVERNEPISFPLSGVIPCWTEGVQKIKVGGKAKLICPAETAYGDGGSGEIPGGAALAFEVELLGIE